MQKTRRARMARTKPRSQPRSDAMVPAAQSTHQHFRFPEPATRIVMLGIGFISWLTNLWYVTISWQQNDGDELVGPGKMPVPRLT